ncbi:MAG: hypothetical protein IPK16_25245 [Anaerolineales bacterium]|nr:hypothetical protein [Anaerolineales bacterium]
MKFFNVQERLHGVRTSLRRSKIHMQGKTRERLVASLVTLAVVASMVTMAAWPTPTSASYTNVLYNGSFEQGFTSQAGCGMVGGGGSASRMVGRPTTASMMTSGTGRSLTGSTAN